MMVFIGKNVVFMDFLMAMLVYRRVYFFPNHHFGHLSSKFRGYRGRLFFLEVFDSSVGSFVGFDGSFGGYEVGKKR